MGKTLIKEVFFQDEQKHHHGRGEDRRVEEEMLFRSETPPRAWGRRSISGCGCDHLRNTPTGVGKTAYLYTKSRILWKHPHGRGEDPCESGIYSMSSETPPRAWGRRLAFDDSCSDLGNTPTGVGKTIWRHRVLFWFRKHPHGRGEDHITGGQSNIINGNTPTGVGKTFPSSSNL